MKNYMVQLENITKQFGGYRAVDDLNLNVKAGEFLTLLGPSGCGKTTTLRMIAGFEKPTSGYVKIDEKKVDNVEPYRREANTVFQSYSLFPHMNVAENIAFGLKMKKINKQEIRERVKEALNMVQLEDYGGRSVKQLSGGQQQRIAIARAIVNNPKVLLLDEPLGALDLKLRKQMQIELKRLQQSLGITFIYVTHDQEEALTMSDRIVVMNKGKIEQMGSPNEIYEKPKTRFVANFIGETNIFKGVVDHLDRDYALLNVAGQHVLIPKSNDLKEAEEVYISVRPENTGIVSEKQNEPFVLTGAFKEKIYIGTTTKVVVELNDGSEMVVHESNGKMDDMQKGNEISISWEPAHSVILR
ncbi:ABC transporter ATP-binding protein [Lentibacillus sp. N15]|uniref:ABC transporter ATP-binding protein n=1 Tax=Lentibacillus songyuanensis TaxID=3136161 RepID=UPI0031B9BB67